MTTHSVDAVVHLPQGLHARPIVKFSELAQSFESKIVVSKKGGENRDDPVDAESVMQLLTLAAIHGTILLIKAEGNDAKAACEKLKEFVESETECE